MENEINTKLSLLNTKNKKLRDLRIDNYKIASKTRLAKILEKKLKTAFIGAISAVEDNIGYLWGKNKETPMTDKEKEFKIIWETIRNKILNNGNSQIRAVYNELEEYEIVWNRYNYDFKVKKEKE